MKKKMFKDTSREIISNSTWKIEVTITIDVHTIITRFSCQEVLANWGFHDKRRIKYIHVKVVKFFVIHLIVVLMRKLNGRKIIQPNILWYDECGKMWWIMRQNLKFRSNLNLLGDLNEKYTAKFYISKWLLHITTFQFISVIFH